MKYHLTSTLPELLVVVRSTYVICPVKRTTSPILLLGVQSAGSSTKLKVVVNSAWVASNRGVPLRSGATGCRSQATNSSGSRVRDRGRMRHLHRVGCTKIGRASCRER